MLAFPTCYIFLKKRRFVQIIWNRSQFRMIRIGSSAQGFRVGIDLGDRIIGMAIFSPAAPHMSCFDIG